MNNMHVLDPEQLAGKMPVSIYNHSRDHEPIIETHSGMILSVNQGDRQGVHAKVRIDGDVVERWVFAGDQPIVATVCYYSDRKVFDIVARTPKILTLRERRAILTKKPVMVEGGFAGVVTEPAEWKTEPDEKGIIRKASMRKDGKFRLVGYQTSGDVCLGVDSYYYDYSF